MPASPPRRVGLALLLLACLCATGCVEADETWVLDAQGGGEYALSVRWDADLWRRVGDHLGVDALARLVGRPFPLRAEEWRDGLTGLEGVEVLSLEERGTETGLREISLRVRFRHLRDLLRWEVLARRTVRVQAVAAPGGDDSPPTCHLWMEPLAQVPVLDRLAALLDAVDHPPPPSEGGARDRDPPLLERLGLQREVAEVVWRMVKPKLEGVRLRFRFEVPGTVTSRAGAAPDAAGGAAAFEFGFPALRAAETQRGLAFAWRLRAFDQAPEIEHAGDADPRARSPAPGAAGRGDR